MWTKLGKAAMETYDMLYITSGEKTEWNTNIWMVSKAQKWKCFCWRHWPITALHSDSDRTVHKDEERFIYRCSAVATGRFGVKMPHEMVQLVCYRHHGNVTAHSTLQPSQKQYDSCPYFLQHCMPFCFNSSHYLTGKDLDMSTSSKKNHRLHLWCSQLRTFGDASNNAKMLGLHQIARKFRTAWGNC